MRGVVDLEVAIKGGERDLHSGVNGGLLPAARPFFGHGGFWGAMGDIDFSGNSYEHDLDFSNFYGVLIVLPEKKGDWKRS